MQFCRNGYLTAAVYKRVYSKCSICAVFLMQFLDIYFRSVVYSSMLYKFLSSRKVLVQFCIHMQNLLEDTYMVIGGMQCRCKVPFLTLN